MPCGFVAVEWIQSWFALALGDCDPANVVGNTVVLYDDRTDGTDVSAAATAQSAAVGPARDATKV